MQVNYGTCGINIQKLGKYVETPQLESQSHPFLFTAKNGTIQGFGLGPAI